MLVEQIIKKTVDLQGFRVHTVTKKGKGFVAELRPDARIVFVVWNMRYALQIQRQSECSFFSSCPSLEYSSLAALSTSQGVLFFYNCFCLLHGWLGQDASLIHRCQAV